MKFLVVFCLIALAAGAEDEPQNESQEVESSATTVTNSNTDQPLSQPQSNPSFNSQLFPTSPLNYGNKNGVNSGHLPTFLGSFPTVPTANANFFNPNGGVPNFSQVPKPLLPAPSGSQGNAPQTFSNLPNNAISSLGLGAPQSTSLTSGVFPAYSGYQGVPAGAYNPNSANVAYPTQNVVYPAHSVVYPQFTGSPYRVLTTETLPNLTPAGYQLSQAGTPTLPAFTGPFAPVPNGVYPPNQGVLKTTVPGNTHTPLNLPNLTGGSSSNSANGNAFSRQ